MAEHGSTEAVKAIVATEGGKKLAVFSGDHGKPIDLAALEGFREIVEVLREYSDIGDLSVDEIMAEGKYNCLMINLIILVVCGFQNHIHVKRPNFLFFPQFPGKRKQVEQQEAREAQSKEDDSSFPAGMKKISLEDIPPPKSHEDIDSANQLKEQANKLFAKGDFLGALKLYDEVSGHGQRGRIVTASWLRTLLLVAFSRRISITLPIFRHEDIFQFVIQAVSLNGLEAVFYSNRSACYMELGEPEKALEQAQIALMIR